MDTMQIANSLPMWIACAFPVCLVIVQAVLFWRDAWKAGEHTDLTKTQMKRAAKSSAITSIGPSIVVLSGMLSLLVTVGAPIGWMRLSMIGSVMFESVAAGLGTSAIGVTLGTDTMTDEALAMALWTMILCSIGWVIFATIMANRMDKLEKKVTRGSSAMLGVIASSAIIGVFASLMANYLSKPFINMIQKASAAVTINSWKSVLSSVLGAAIMFALTKIAKKKGWHWLSEWSLTITILAAMIITALV